jgi:uncharacterized protein
VESEFAVAANEVSRREFLRLAMMSSAMVMGAGSVVEGEQPTSHAQLRELAPGVVRPEGWLRGMLEKQAAQLGSKLPQVSWPFNGAYWAGEEKDESIKKGQSWFAWEQKGYWIDGAARLAMVLDDDALMEQVWATINYTLTHPDADGYLGPQLFKDPKGDNHRWPQAVFFRSLIACADAPSTMIGATSKGIADAMRKHYLNDQASYGTPERNVTNIESILWCYERTGDTRLLALAENAWADYMKVAADELHGDLSLLRVYGATPIDSHGVTYAETIKLPAILYLSTGKEEYLKFAQAAERRIFDHHMLIDGIPSTSEFYSTVTSLDLHETCDIADHTWSWGYQLMATGDGIWADRIERACFNAAPGAIKKDWKALQYMSCPNQFLATLNSDHHLKGLGGFKMAYQPNPGKRVACCGGNVHRIFPNYAIRMWMQAANGGLAAVLYGPSKIKANVGAGNEPVEIEQTTSYPFEEQIHFTIHTSRAVNFPLSLRIPAWCQKPRLTVNGVPTMAQRTEKGFLVVRRTFRPGDTLTLTLPMKTAVTHWPQGGVGLEHGPLVYSLAIKTNWKPIFEEKYTTSEYPSWEATPTSDWTFGLALDANQPTKGIEFKRRLVHAGEKLDPWENPPTMLSVRAHRIENWELQANPENPAQKFTPPLPELGTRKFSPTVEQLTLVPYGSTELRVTIFPTV